MGCAIVHVMIRQAVNPIIICFVKQITRLPTVMEFLCLHTFRQPGAIEIRDLFLRGFTDKMIDHIVRSDCADPLHKGGAGFRIHSQP